MKLHNEAPVTTGSLAGTVFGIVTQDSSATEETVLKPLSEIRRTKLTRMFLESLCSNS